MPVTVRLPKQEEVPANKLPPVKTDRLINSVTFFGDSAIPEDDPIYKSVFEAAKLLAQNGYSIVDGGGPGIMKAATDGAESVNGKTIAVYWQPKLASLFEGKNLANVTDESETFSNYLIRTLGLIEHGDAYVVCKGGTGTISEWGMVWALSKLYYGCNKPVILYGDFWDKLVESVQKYMNIDDLELGVLYNAYKPEDILPILALHEKKIEHCKRRKFSGDEGAFVLGTETSMVQKAYDFNAAEWHAMHAGNPVAQEQLDEFMSLVNPPAKVLDVGAGPGTDASYLSTKYAVTGIELSRKFADIAKYENPNVELVNADIITYEIGVNKYKGIWARNSLHHIPEKDQDPVFKKMADALVQGGILYIIAREGEGEFVEEDVKNYLKVEKFYHTFSDMELKARGERAGLKLVRIDHQHRSHKWIIGIFRKE
jgi:hypothetical protein